MARRLFYLIAVLCVAFLSGMAGSLIMQNYLIPQDVSRIVFSPAEKRATSQVQFADLISDISPSMVRIVGVSAGDVRHLTFGALISSDGWLVTPGRLPQTGIAVLDRDNRKFEVEKVIYNNSLEVSFLKSKKTNAKPFELFDRSRLSDTFDGFILKGFSTIEPHVITAIGYPFSQIISGPLSPHKINKRFNSDESFAGDGYLVITSDGVLVGFTTENGIIPIAYAKDVLPQLFKTKKISTPTIPIQYYDIAWWADLSKEYRKLNFDRGALIAGTPGSVFRLRSGEGGTIQLFGGDIITAINDEVLDRNRGLSDIIQQYRVGDRISVKILRSGAKIENSFNIFLEQTK